MKLLHKLPMRSRHRERGSVLLIGLIFLMILTMIVLSVLSGGTLEERMAANDRNRQVALQSADGMLRVAEGLLTAKVKDNFSAYSIPASGCVQGYCGLIDTTADPRWKTITWSSSVTGPSSSESTENYQGTDSQPRFIIEILVRPRAVLSAGQIICEPGLYNITVRGFGQDKAAVFIQSTYRVTSAKCGD